MSLTITPAETTPEAKLANAKQMLRNAVAMGLTESMAREVFRENITGKDREAFVENDEFWFYQMRAAPMSMADFIHQNQASIDASIRRSRSA